MSNQLTTLAEVRVELDRLVTDLRSSEDECSKNGWWSAAGFYRDMGDRACKILSRIPTDPAPQVVRCPECGEVAERCDDVVNPELKGWVYCHTDGCMMIRFRSEWFEGKGGEA